MTAGLTETISEGIAEAESIIRTKNDEIITLFEEYTPKWFDAGVSLVNNLTEGANFQKLIDKARAAFEEIWVSISETSAGGSADEAAADDPWANYRNMTVTERMKLADSRIGRSASSLVVNINQPAESPAETARAVTNAAKDMGFAF